MSDFHIATAALAAIILFLFGLENFSKEVQRISGEKFRKFLARFTKIPLIGVLLGTVITSIIQSSSATSIITIGLVNAGLISFKNSLGIIFGANVGTTITAQLVAFKLTAFAPYLIVSGFFLSLIRNRYSFFGKSIFYFGFVFFSLNLISSSVAPLQSDERLVNFLSSSQNIFLTIAIGAIFTALVQSSSVTTGMAVIFTQGEILSLENAVPIIMGANIGTTVTALLAMFNMDVAAKKTAMSHFLFNVGGVIFFLPFVRMITGYFEHFDPAVALANIHLVFNLMASGLFVLLVNPFARLVEKLVSGNHHLNFPLIQFPEVDEKLEFAQARQFLDQNFGVLFGILKENYSLVTLSIETNYKSIYAAVLKRNAYVDYLKGEFTNFLSKVINRGGTDEEYSKEIIEYLNRYEYLYQIHDSIKDFTSIKSQMDEMYIEIQSDGLLFIREISGQMLNIFENLGKNLIRKLLPDERRITEELKDMQDLLNRINRALLKFILDPERKDPGTLTRFLAISQRLKDILLNLSHLIEDYRSQSS